ncbi:uncharacterized protein LOC131213459 [Anopheles bellator]|uniref:uncharacterized protein LOC131213459 n=1 Tax=Anopheles bellator TaxID=139047 RepID=UPI0026491256|nr:uncharacterized protein LOC131213459 [Anopheles bellator]
MDREHKVLNIDPPVPSPRPRPGRLAADDGSSGSFHGESENATIVVRPTDNAGGGCSSFVSLPSNVAASDRAVPGSGIGEELNRPVPAPRRVKGQLYNEGEEGAKGFRGTRYENVIVISQKTPIRVAPPLPSTPSYHPLPASSPSLTSSPATPAMPPQPSPSPPPGVSFVKRRDNGSRRVAAAAAATADRRRHSVGPGSLSNLLDGAAGDSGNGMEAGYHREATECELGGGRRDSGDHKYKTSSPGDLFKSIGTTSRMLTESIGERVAHKSRKVAENVRNTSSTIVSWSQETAGKLKSVGRSSTRSSNTSAGGVSSGIDSTTTTCGTADSWRQSAKKERDKPKSEGGMMQNIKFTSPLLDEPSTIITTTTVLPRNTTITTTTTSRVNDAEKDKRSRAGADKQPASSSSGQTYDIPRRGNKPSNLRPAPGSRPGSSSGGGSVHSASESNTTSPVSSASSSNTTTPDRGVGGTVCREAQRLPPNFRRLPLTRSNLYTTVLPKCQRVEKGKPGLGWIPPPPPPEPLADRHKQHKSESNLHEPTFYVQHPMLLDDGGQLCDRQGGSQNHLYGKLNILPRRAISSSSSSGGGGDLATGGACSTRSSMADSEEDNMFPEGRQLVELGSLVEVQPQTAGGKRQMVEADGGDGVGGENEVVAIINRSRQIFSRQASITTTTMENEDSQQTEAAVVAKYRPLSWTYYVIAHEQTSSSVSPPILVAEVTPGTDNNGEQGNRSAATNNLEPYYGNAGGGTQPIYNILAEPQVLSSSRSVLQPVPVAHGGVVNQGQRHDYDTVSFYSDIVEFDPLADTSEANYSQSSLEPELCFDSSKPSSRELWLIEDMLNSKSSAMERTSLTSPSQQQRQAADENEAAGGGGSDQVDRGPQIPERSDSLLLPGVLLPKATVPVKPKRTKLPNSQLKPEESMKGNSGNNSRSIGHIVHQNLSLPADSMENLVEESLVQPYLSVVEEESIASGGSNGDPLDLSYPKRHPRKTNWYVEDVQTADPALNDNATAASGGGEAAAASPGAASSRQSALGTPPTYFEAIGGTDPLFERGLAAASVPSHRELPKATSGGSGSSVASKLLNVLKRRSSLNRGSSTSAAGAGATKTAAVAVTTTMMVPKPALTERLITHKGHVLKIPSGKMGDLPLYYEMAPRSVVLRERILQTFLDPQQTLLKETIHLHHLLALQCVLQHKYMGEGGLPLHVFEIVLALPKGGAGSASGGLAAVAAAAMSSNPDLLMSGGGGHKTSRASHMFATHNRSDRNLWMSKVLLSVTDVFPAELLREFLRAGWCYVKKSVSACWAGAWVLLTTKRRLHIYSFADHQLDELDLRKARCIGAIEDSSSANDPQSLAKLYVEAGPTMLIDCPPFPTLYLIMSSPRETHIWRKVVLQVAHENGSTLHTQQLTLADVPVLVDKCVNFIYAQGAMSEGIYRRSGSVSAVGRILKLFADDAFAVQLTRAEFNEHDVAGALKKFIRELPGSFFGKFASSFTAIGMLYDESLRRESYQQLLRQLPHIEHNTLKKLISHLAFIASLEQHNRMGIPNLAMIWGSTLMANSIQRTVADEASSGYHQSDADVVADLIRMYPQLFPMSDDELRKDQMMLEVLQRYHAAAENLSDAVKHSGDLKMWITIECDNSPDEKQNNNTPNAEEKQQVNVDITPTKTASDVCKELASRTVYPWNKLTLYEIVLNGALVRPIHYGEKVLEIVVRWTYWDEADRKNNYLTLRPTTTLNDAYRTIQKSPVLEPTMELQFADQRTKALRSCQLQLMKHTLVVLRKFDKKDKGFEKLCTIDLTRVTAYIGCEPKRDKSSLRWAITLVSKDFAKRTREEPFVGHIFGGLDFASQMLWYSSILYSHHKDDILPSGDLFFL